MNPLRLTLQVISWVACSLTILPALAFLFAWINLDQVKAWMLVATVVWFAVTPWWMGREHGRLAEHPTADDPASV